MIRSGACAARYGSSLGPEPPLAGDLGLARQDVMARSFVGMKLSIVVITKQRRHLLVRCLDSIFCEVEDDFSESEVIVIDGGSTDGTREFLEGLDRRLTYWVSEPDSGLGQAVNKGVARARGDIIRVVGDDDEFVPGNLRAMMHIIDRMPAYDVVGGHNEVIFESNDGVRETRGQGRYTGEVGRSEMLRWGRPAVLVPEACFFRRTALERVGCYDEGWRWWGFLDLFFRMIDAGSRFFIMPVTILRTYQTARSETFSNSGDPSFWQEQLRVFEKHGGIGCRLWQQCGGSLRPDRVTHYFVRRLCAQIGFHPRRMLRESLGVSTKGVRRSG